MDRDRALQFALALLAIVSLAAAAATLDSAVVSDGSSGVGGNETGLGPSGGEPTAPAADRSVGASAGQQALLCLPWLREPPAVLALLLLFGGLFAAVYRSTSSGVAGVAVCGAVGLPVVLLWLGLAFCGESTGSSALEATPGGGQSNGSGLSEGGSGGLGEASGEALSSPALLLALVVIVALVVLVAAAATGRDRRAATAEPEPEPDDVSEAVGRVAGTAADRIDAETDVDAENEVYRAWREMTASLDVDSPETTTPREFEQAAVDAGMARADVAALTELFESVRYGGLDPTDEQEQRAVETLRRIESGYGSD